tara:strand:+ start:236 stop:466 length:231 start_codon:yes stop_codon:yes gene_type:complete
MCCVNPQSIFNEIKNLGINKRKIGKKELTRKENNIIDIHKIIKILELKMQLDFLSAGMHSFITLVSIPKACLIISK